MTAIEKWQDDGMDWWNGLTRDERRATMAVFFARFPQSTVSVAACYDAFVAEMPEPPVARKKDTV